MPRVRKNKYKISENINLISEQHKDIDILINNAAITNDNLFLRMKEEQWNEVININLKGYYITQGYFFLFLSLIAFVIIFFDKI